MSTDNPINEYLTALNVFLNTPAKIINGEMLVMVNGRQVPFAEYQNANPKPTYRPPTKGNCDSGAIDSDVVPQNGSRSSSKK